MNRSFQSYMQRLIINIYNDDKHYDSILRPTAHLDTLTAYKRIEFMGFLCNMGAPNCIETSVSLFDKWMLIAPQNATL